MSADGSYIAIGGAYFERDPVVRIYRLEGGRWVPLGQDIEAEGVNDGAWPRISSDGTRVAVGGWGNDENGEDSGQVRVFELSSLQPAGGRR